MIKKVLDFFVFQVFSRKRQTSYWWKLRTEAKRAGLKGYIRRIQYHSYEDKHNCFLPLVALIDDMPCMPHGPTGVFISSGAHIGKNCTIFHQVTIGSNTLKDSTHMGAPKIGDNVYIGCGAKIIGGITIGNNVRIGANCVITSDIPDNCTVVLEKPRIILKNNTNKFVPYEDWNAEQDSLNKRKE